MGLDAARAARATARCSWSRAASSEAEAVYRADLGLDDTLPRPCQHPGNVWSLHGYHECLTRLGKHGRKPRSSTSSSGSRLRAPTCPSAHPASAASPSRETIPNKGPWPTRRKAVPSRPERAGPTGASPGPGPEIRLAGSRAPGRPRPGRRRRRAAYRTARPRTSITASLIRLASSQDVGEGLRVAGRDQAGRAGRGQRRRRPGRAQLRHRPRVPELEQLRDPLDVGQAARTELEVQRRLDAARHPLGLHPRLDPADLPDALPGRYRPRDTGSRRPSR